MWVFLLYYSLEIIAIGKDFIELASEYREDVNTLKSAESSKTYKREGWEWLPYFY